MEGKTKVEFIHSDNQHKEWQKGEKGYIDGYIRGGDDIPYCAVVIDERIVLCQPHFLKVIK